MKEAIVSFETAKLLKEKGFDYNIYNGDFDYNERGNLLSEVDDNYYQQLLYPAPTLSLAQQWLREVHNIHVSVDHKIHMKWFYNVMIIAKKSEDYIQWITKTDTGHNHPLVHDNFNTYMEALEAGITEALILI